LNRITLFVTAHSGFHPAFEFQNPCRPHSMRFILSRFSPQSQDTLRQQNTALFHGGKPNAHSHHSRAPQVKGEQHRRRKRRAKTLANEARV